MSDVHDVPFGYKRSHLHSLLTRAVSRSRDELAEQPSDRWEMTQCECTDDKYQAFDEGCKPVRLHIELVIVELVSIGVRPIHLRVCMCFVLIETPGPTHDSRVHRRHDENAPDKGCKRKMAHELTGVCGDALN